MEFRIAKTEFLRGLKLAQGISDKKSAMPMLGNVMLRTQGKGQLLVAATDLNVSLTAELKSTNTSEGGITLGAKNLYELIANAPGDEITLKSTEGHHAEIKSGKAKYKLLGQSDRDFPKVPSVHEVKLVKVECAALREMIDRTIFAVSQDDQKYHLAGVYFESDGKVCRASATDGHRLATTERSMAGPALTKGVIVPRKGLGEIRKLIESSEHVRFGVAEPTMFASSDGITIAAKLIDAQFPDLRAMLAGINNTNHVTVDRAQMVDALKRVQLMTTETRGVKIEPLAKSMRLTSENPDMGEVVDEIAAECTRSPLAIGFNPRFLVEILSTMTADQVAFEFGTDVDPAIIHPLGDVTHRCIAMPMRL